MRINGATDKLGEWNKQGPKCMKLGKERKWLTGEFVEPWEMLNVRFSQAQMPGKLIYKYSLYSQKENIALWEREPSRMLEICEP